MIQIIDNFIPLQWQEDIKNTLKDHSFPWYYTSDVTYNDDIKNPAMYHVFKTKSHTTSPFFNFISPMAYLTGLQIKDIVRAKSFLQFPLATQSKVDKLHVDVPYKHTVLLYYVFDSDGDTIIVDKKLEHKTIETNLNFQDFTILEKVTPKQGRAIIFDGEYYHTAEQPNENMRCIINFDLVTEND
jgi:hypothetical protein